jgi:hypothetical protein
MRLTILLAAAVLALAVDADPALARPVGVVQAGDRASSLSRGLAPDGHRAIAAAGLRLSLPRRWHGDVAYGSLGADPFGVAEIIVANFRLPADTTGCEGPIPTLSRRRVVVRIYDYGSGVLGPPSPPSPVIRLTRIRPVHDSAMRSRGFSEARVRFHGHSLVVQGVFGARRPPASLLRAVRQLLASARSTPV